MASDLAGHAVATALGSTRSSINAAECAADRTAGQIAAEDSKQTTPELPLQAAGEDTDAVMHQAAADEHTGMSAPTEPDSICDPAAIQSKDEAPDASAADPLGVCTTRCDAAEHEAAPAEDVKQAMLQAHTVASWDDVPLPVRTAPAVQFGSSPAAAVAGGSSLPAAEDAAQTSQREVHVPPSHQQAASVEGSKSAAKATDEHDGMEQTTCSNADEARTMQPMHVDDAPAATERSPAPPSLALSPVMSNAPAPGAAASPVVAKEQRSATPAQSQRKTGFTAASLRVTDSCANQV